MRGTLRIGAITTESFVATIEALRDKSLILSSRDTYIRVKNNLTGTITETVAYPYPVLEGWSFANVVTMLTATPHVNPAEEITLDLNPTISDVIATTAGGPPTTRSSSTNTTTRVKNGETIVIGGLLQTAQTTGQTGVPLLSQIPIIGALFRSSKAEERSSQILLFITPQIIKEVSGS
jgi:type II secretory pathway component GspD/PulD (secretin)